MSGRCFSYLMMILWLFTGTSLYAYETSKVERVFDGDGIQISNLQNIHLLGVDAPEAIQDSKLYHDAKVYKLDIYGTMGLGKSSKQFLRYLVQDEAVRVEYDEKTKDKKGLRNAYVYLPVCKGKCEYTPQEGYDYVTLDDGVYVFVNATMIKSGYAIVRESDLDAKNKEQFKQFEKSAQDRGMGFWAKS
jgi:endonuclease YncB( thermonuclease family)